MSIKVEQLSKEFGEQKAVDNISFEIGSGAIVGFLGPNGAGKSTTMKMLSTTLLPSAGRAEVGGFDVVQQPMEVRRILGYLAESNPLYNDMYVREYLEFVTGIHRLGRYAGKRIDELIGLTGLNREVKKKIGTLSKGYKQRVGLAQALLHDPQVLILDEPTSGLDHNQISEIRDLVLQIGREKTVLLSTHIMQEVQAMCSRVIIINNGRIVADDAIGNIGAEQQQLQGLIVEFERAFAPKAFEELRHLTEARQLEDNRWHLVSRDPDLLRKELLSWSVQNDMTIVTLQNSSQSLEEAFKRLTR